MVRLCFILFGFASLCEAAPIPATSSSEIIAPLLGRFISPEGFMLNSAGTNWVHMKAPKSIESVATVYKAPKATEGVQAALLVRVEPLSKPTSIKGYIHRWAKDYPRFGFEILASRPIKLKTENGYLMDLVHRETNKQLRQVVFIKNQRAVVLTCRDQMKSFNDNLRACNDIIRTFTWTE